MGNGAGASLGHTPSPTGAQAPGRRPPGRPNPLDQRLLGPGRGRGGRGGCGGRGPRARLEATFREINRLPSTNQLAGEPEPSWELALALSSGTGGLCWRQRWEAGDSDSQRKDSRGRLGVQPWRGGGLPRRDRPARAGEARAAHLVGTRTRGQAVAVGREQGKKRGQRGGGRRGAPSWSGSLACLPGREDPGCLPRPRPRPRLPRMDGAASVVCSSSLARRAPSPRSLPPFSVATLSLPQTVMGAQLRAEVGLTRVTPWGRWCAGEEPARAGHRAISGAVWEGEGRRQGWQPARAPVTHKGRGEATRGLS